MKLIIAAIIVVAALVTGSHQPAQCVDPNANSSTVDCSLLSQ